MTFSDLPIEEQVDEMVAGWWNDESYDVSKQDILELLKREYERGLAERIPAGESNSLYHDLYSGKTKEWTAGFRTGYDLARNISVSEPTTTQYTANVSEKTDDN